MQGRTTFFESLPYRNLTFSCLHFLGKSIPIFVDLFFVVIQSDM